jgi:hypothetical protein
VACHTSRLTSASQSGAFRSYEWKPFAINLDWIHPITTDYCLTDLQQADRVDENWLI